MTNAELYDSLDEKQQLHVFIDFIRMAIGFEPVHAKKCRRDIIGSSDTERTLGMNSSCFNEPRNTY